MARTKQAGRRLVSCAVWKRNTSLGRPIGRSAKSTDKRKRKKKVATMNETPEHQEPDSSVTLDEAPETTTSPTPDTTVTAASSDESSTIPKLINGTTASTAQINGASANSFPTNGNVGALFHSLCYSEDVLSSLPNRTWAIHSSELPEKRIVVSSMSMHNSQDSGLTPLYMKQIIFDERLNFEILLANSRIVPKDKPTSISTMDQFEDLLDYVDGLKVCVGGPPISQFSRVNPECAYRDSMNNWRHNLCSLEISHGDICESCNSLEEILRRHAQRIRTTVKSGGKRKR